MSSPPTTTAAGPLHAPKPERASPLAAGGRPPSLNQLAARMSLNNANAGTSSSSTASRPRLPVSVLRTGSAASTLSASTNDSMAVNAPTTRSVSPAATATPPQSTTPSIPEDGPLPQSSLSSSVTSGAAADGAAAAVASNGEPDPLTSDRLELHDAENPPAPPEKKVKGYKNIPSLDAITARLAKTRSLSIDGSARPPEAAMIEDPKTPGVPVRAPEHPLQFDWVIYHDTKTKVPFTPAPAPAPVVGDGTASGPASAYPQPVERADYEAGLTVIGEFDSVEGYCRYFNWLKPPSALDKNSNYHLFKQGIKPMWEDPSNASGGKWVLTMKNNSALLDRCWAWLTMALVGQELEEGDDICGAVVSLRSKVDRIQVWTRSKEDVERLNGIGKKLVKLLDVSEADGIGLEFQYNTDDRPLPNKFLAIQAMPNSTFRPTFSHRQSTGPGTPTTPGVPLGLPPVQDMGSTPMGAGPGAGVSMAPGAGVPAPGGAFGSFGVGNIGGWRGRKT
ncbi:translation initiation factor eIF4e [Coniophora puteana RWD-64-598 SS2]|uniref:Translation initiation factor eIF4e n=1 Tax=Coniophora puteana (strain RWD-64-598) TaxID=741705 RepID=R7SDZ4_CONPW|nr:translation initiation factor eIF4e [Coniophora puteana RWD-64-598 SS2]EIW74391.1 translation initiation factor eIF4e [Coniophora puteana RWD-64-598 SS2]